MMTTVRPAREEAAAAAVDVVRRSIQQLCVADHHEDRDTLVRWVANKTPESFLGWISNSAGFCVVSKSGSCISRVGLLHRSGKIRLSYIAPGSQRQWIGKVIHGELEAAAKRWGLSALHLNSTALARPFYEAIGRHATSPLEMEGVVNIAIRQAFPAATEGVVLNAFKGRGHVNASERERRKNLKKAVRNAKVTALVAAVRRHVAGRSSETADNVLHATRDDVSV